MRAVGVALVLIGAGVLLFALFDRGDQPGWIDIVAGVGIALIIIGFRTFTVPRVRGTKTE